MTAFVIRLACYCALWAAMLLSTYGFNRYFIEHRRPSLAGTRILIAEDPQPGNAINPDVLTGSRSVTLAGEHLLMTYHKLESLLQRPHDVQIVILGFAPHNIAPFRDVTFADPITSRNFFGAMYPIMERSDFEPLEVNEEAYWLSLVRRLLLVPRLEHHRRYMGGFVSVPVGPLRGDAEAEAKAVAERYYYVVGDVAAPSSVATTYLLNIIDLLEVREVGLVLVSTPVHPEYLANIPKPFSDHFEHLTAIARQRDVMVVDGSTYLRPDMGFADLQHLNHAGSIAFTNLLIRDLGLDEDG